MSILSKDKYIKFYKEEIEILSKYIPELQMQINKAVWDLSRARRYLRDMERTDLIDIQNAFIHHKVDTNDKVRKILDKLCKEVQIEKKDD